MDKLEFKILLENHLLPMFTGAKLGEIEECNSNCKIVAYKDVCTLRIKPRNATYRVKLIRSQGFLSDEIKLIECFIQELEKIEADKANFEDLVLLLPKRVISKLLGHTTEGKNTLQKAILWFESLASQTYEGKQIVAAIGITGSNDHGPIDIVSLDREDFSKILSNGFDTMYQCGKDGRIFNLISLPVRDPESYAPVRMGAIANWAQKNRVSLVLNRNGEILIFKDKMLKFAKRRGVWIFYSHESALKQFGQISRDIKNAVYQSCLDASFSRTGGCIAILSRDGQRDLVRNKVVTKRDKIDDKKITRTKLIYKILNKKSFQRLDRLIRQEFLAIDGAVVLTHQGEVITIGAIVKVPGGSTGGGRKAAAMNLSNYGLGIKISADGPITGFRDKDEVFTL